MYQLQLLLYIEPVTASVKREAESMKRNYDHNYATARRFQASEAYTKSLNLTMLVREIKATKKMYVSIKKLNGFDSTKCDVLLSI